MMATYRDNDTRNLLEVSVTVHRVFWIIVAFAGIHDKLVKP